jgi:DNA-binding NarL/FixJ family response regulator
VPRGLRASANPDPESSAPISVVLARFDEVTELGLLQVLKTEPAIEVLAHGVEDASLAQVLSRCSPHVLIVDERCATSSALSDWNSAAPFAGVVILGRDYSHWRTNELTRAGATCAMLSVTADELLALIRRVAAGERATTPLTPREQEVLELVAAHFTHAEIAELLHISIETARSHTANIRQKLGVRRNRELGAFRPAAGHP